MARLPRDQEREQLEREIEGEEYCGLLGRLREEHGFPRAFSTWAEVIAFMREGESDDPRKDEVLRPILAAHVEDGDPRWRTILLVIFWPGLKAICIQRRGWNPEFDDLWADAVWAFLQSVRRLDPAKRSERFVQKIVNDTIERLGAGYRRARKRDEIEISTDPDLLDYLAGGAEDSSFAEVDLFEEQRFSIDAFRGHLESGRITEGGFDVLVGTLVHGQRLREYAEESGLSYQAAKKRRHRAQAAIRRFEKS